MLNTSRKTKLKYDWTEDDLSLRRTFYFQMMIWKVVSNDISFTGDASGKLGIPFSCASCEYDNDSDGDCNSCPSKSIWSIGVSEEDSSKSHYDSECGEVDSCPFEKWSANKFGTHKGITQSLYDAQFFALLISDESKRLLQENL